MKAFKERLTGPSAKNKDKSQDSQDTPSIETMKSADSDTVQRSGNPSKKSSSSSKKKSKSTSSSSGSGSKNNNSSSRQTTSPLSLEEQLQQVKEQIAVEKAGKRKLFHSLVKLANELRRTKSESVPLLEQAKYADKNWYEGGMWRAPELLPGVAVLAQEQQQQQQQTVVSRRSMGGTVTSTQQHTPAGGGGGVGGISTMMLPQPKKGAVQPMRMRPAISLSDLFFNLVIVTAFTRVGVAISQQSVMQHALLSDDSISSLLYFAVFWNVWSKEASYSTRFDTTDLSATVETLVTCFGVLFASLSVQAPVNSTDGTRIMMMAAFVAGLHCFLHIRVAVSANAGTSSSSAAAAAANANSAETSPSSSTSSLQQSALAKTVMAYALFNVVMTSLEMITWCIGIFVLGEDFKYRWAIFLTGIVLSLRVPRAFMANDFHAACSKRGVLFILLLGFLLQSIVVVASEFFEYQTPTLEHYSFIGAACLMFFCIKLLYVDDADTLAEDHALLVNRTAGFFFNVGQFCLLLSTTVMGSGLNLLTHSYLAATAALPDHAKNLVCGGFSAVLLSTFFIKSMHLKRVPTNPRNQALFVAAYVIQSVVLLFVVAVTAVMCFGNVADTFLGVLMQNDIQLLFSLSGAALFVVLMSWLDEGVELALYKSAEDSREFRIHPFGLWSCLKPGMTQEEMEMDESDRSRATRTLSSFKPLLGSSVALMQADMGYDSVQNLAEDGGEQQPLLPKEFV